MRREGKVTWFNDKKGFGFITGDDGVDVFVHYTEIVRDGFQSLEPGERVAYAVTDEEIAPKAVDVHLVEEGGRRTLL
ncbi:cold-shock protein [Pseudodesulfovibrio alkaliphilus]|uniref:cold-shock protein n=1 Tax=Pseudodesulfovibrio alkaliphilus TaxID=2661613 RepID=UPI003462DE57